MNRPGTSLLSAAAALALANVSALHVAGAEDATFFEEKVKPLIERRCFECHSHGAKIKGGLALDSRDAWQAGGDTGRVIVPGDPEKSLLIRAVEYREPEYEMPPKGKLPAEEIAILREWVKRGAPDPRTGGAATAKKGIDIEEGRKFWAFRPVSAAVPPEVKDNAWPRRDSDQFLLAALEAKGLAPAPDADPARLFRRLCYDLTGLPPSPEEMRDFSAAYSRDAQRAVEEAADRLLASPRFGEKWARHWLDLARYADSNGSSFNPPFPMAWRYRNWVIAAHNADMPFTEFVTMQLAGDLLNEEPGADALPMERRDDNLIATGFLMLGSKVLGEFDKEQLALDVVDEQVDTIGKSLLGLTLGCARCHDHKFDPVPQRDYYALAGIFTSTVTLEDRLGGPREDESDWSRRGLGGTDARLREFLATNRHEWVKSGAKADGARVKIAEIEGKLREAGRNGAVVAEDARGKLVAELEKARAELAKQSARHAELEAQLPPYAEAVADAEKPGDAQVRIRGVPSSKGDVVPRGFLQVASWAGQPAVNPARSGRLELARWIAAPANPLTARVAANRIWKHLFGEGIVRSVDNFGPRGEPPSHPELLDFLARRFIAHGWRMKPLIRELVTSRAYRMSTRHDPGAFASDSGNRLLWRQHKRRLEPEEIRDTMLVVSGQLDATPAETLLPGLPLRSIEGPDAERIQIVSGKRTIYLPIIRTMEHDILQVFDFPPTAMTSGERPGTTVAPQALYFMNAPFVQDCSKRFATGLMPLLDGVNTESIICEAFTRAVCRAPRSGEARLLRAYLGTQFEGPGGPTVHDVSKLCQAVLGSTQFQLLD